jgi:hypothetical protein
MAAMEWMQTEICIQLLIRIIDITAAELMADNSACKE